MQPLQAGSHLRHPTPCINTSELRQVALHDVKEKEVEQIWELDEQNDGQPWQALGIKYAELQVVA